MPKPDKPPTTPAATTSPEPDAFLTQQLLVKPAVVDPAADDARYIARNIEFGWPVVGRDVRYRTRSALLDYELPAKVVRTRASNDPASPLHPLSGDSFVDLVVFTPGPNGVYVEHDVPFGYGKGMWHWPERVTHIDPAGPPPDRPGLLVEADTP